MDRSRNLFDYKEPHFKLLSRWRHVFIESRDLMIQPDYQLTLFVIQTYISAGSRQLLQSTNSHHGADLSLAFFSSFRFLGPGPSSSLPLGRFFPFALLGVLAPELGSWADLADLDGPAFAFGALLEPAAAEFDGTGDGDLPNATKSWSIVV